MDQDDKNDPLFNAVKKYLDRIEEVQKTSILDDSNRRVDKEALRICDELNRMEMGFTKEQAEKIHKVVAARDATFEAFHSIMTMLVLTGKEKTRKHIEALLEQAIAINDHIEGVNKEELIH